MIHGLVLFDSPASRALWLAFFRQFFATWPRAPHQKQLPSARRRSRASWVAALLFVRGFVARLVGVSGWESSPRAEVMLLAHSWPKIVWVPCADVGLILWQPPIRVYICSRFTVNANLSCCPFDFYSIGLFARHSVDAEMIPIRDTRSSRQHEPMAQGKDARKLNSSRQ
jgi:hypothetical protein